MKKSNKKVLEDLVEKNILTNEELINELVNDIDTYLKESIADSKKKIAENKKFTSLKFTKEYLYIKLRFYSKRESVLKATMPL